MEEDAPLMESGLDSLSAVDFRNQVQRDAGLPVVGGFHSVSFLFESSGSFTDILMIF